jgi:Tfp pilus assembly protein PilO
MSVEKNIKLDRSSRRVLLAALGVIAVFGLYRWILWPYSNQLFAARRCEAALDENIRKADFLDITVKKKKANVQQLSKEAQQLRSELFTIGEAREFFASLATIGGQSGCVIQSVSLPPGQKNTAEQAEDESGIVSRKAIITILGGYNNIVRFLDRIMSWQHKVWIESVSIDIDGNSGKLKCQALLTLYCAERMESSQND